MKIDHDLCQAIKAAEAVQPYTDGLEERKRAAEAFLKAKPEHEKIIAVLRKNAARAYIPYQKARQRLDKYIADLGLTDRSGEKLCVGYGDEDHDRFKAAGGKFEVRPRWKATTVIAKLAAAEPKQRDAILKEYGINWK